MYGVSCFYSFSTWPCINYADNRLFTSDANALNQWLSTTVAYQIPVISAHFFQTLCQDSELCKKERSIVIYCQSVARACKKRT